MKHRINKDNLSSNDLNIYKVDDRWSSDDNKYLLELWNDNLSIDEIAEVLEKTIFTTIKNLAWKVSPALSQMLKMTNNQTTKEKILQIFICDYPDLINIQIDETKRAEIQKLSKLEKESRNKRYSDIISTSEDTNISEEKTGLEFLLEKLFFQNKNIKRVEPREIRERLIWLSALTQLFNNEEYEVFFTVFPEDGQDKITYQEASDIIDIPKYRIAEVTRSCINKLVSWSRLMDKGPASFSNWVQLSREAAISLSFTNRNFDLPEVNVNFSKIPKILYPLNEFELTKSAINDLNKANIFCIGDLENISYEELRLEHGIRGDIAAKIYNIYEAINSNE